MIGNYLRKFVEDNHRVIIPNVGAFLRKNNANIPFEASITFSPFLRFNDGLLENLLAEKENISKEAAAEAVSKFIQDLQTSIAEKHPFYIHNLGVFYQDERNAVQFIYAETKQEASRKVNEIMSETEDHNVPFASSLENTEVTLVSEPEEKPLEEVVEAKKEVEEAVEETVAVEAVETVEVEKAVEEVEVEVEKAVEAVEVEKAVEEEAAEAVETPPEKPAVATKTEKLPPKTPKNQAQQLNFASDALQDWIEKRKNGVANQPKDVNQPAEDGEVGATPGEEVAAAQPLTEQPQPQPQENNSFPRVPTYQDAEAKRRREEAIKRALEARREQAKRKEEEIRSEREAAPSPGANSAPFVPGAWEKDVMGKRKSRSYGIWIFLGAMAFVFIAGILALLYSPSLADLIGRGRPDAAEAPAPTSTPPASPVHPAPVFHYVVAGVFNFEDNAHVVSQKLNDTKKLKSEVVQMSDGKFAVCLSRHSSRNAALKNVDKYKKHKINVWVAP